nr:MAG TPA_asm: BRICHOS domain protein [Bacteriophage sp.]
MTGRISKTSLISPQLNDRCSGVPTYHQVHYRLT